MWIYLLQGIDTASPPPPSPDVSNLPDLRLTRGWKRALPALAPLVSDGPIILLSVLVLTQVPECCKESFTLQAGYLFYICHTAH